MSGRIRAVLRLLTTMTASFAVDSRLERTIGLMSPVHHELKAGPRVTVSLHIVGSKRATNTAHPPGQPRPQVSQS